VSKRILVIGPIAPPLGGVSMHISRLIKLLNNDFDFDFIDESRNCKPEYFNIRSLKFYTYFTKIKNAQLIYIHSGKMSLRIFHIVSGKIFRKKIILTIHSFTANKSKITRIFNQLFYKLADKIILVNPDIKKYLFLPQKKTIIKEAFIPPSLEEEDHLPQNIQDLVSDNCKNGNIIICSNASRLDQYNNEDLYGLDLCIEVSRRLLFRKIPFFFIYVVSSMEKNADLFFKTKDLINKLGLEQNFFFTSQSLSFVKLIEISDIVLRPTNTDGDSLTVREAIFLNKLVLASDVTKRPNGVYLFRTRDIDDYESKLVQLINLNLSKDLSKELKKDFIATSKQDYKNFYLSLLKHT
jgi:glycosyltransferase involved in cell wall biosynthesis